MSIESVAAVKVTAGESHGCLTLAELTDFVAQAHAAGVPDQATVKVGVKGLTQRAKWLQTVPAPVGRLG